MEITNNGTGRRYNDWRNTRVPWYITWPLAGAVLAAVLAIAL
ncbi:MAG TPA: hypothetical protein VLF91_03575 [Candidatus Saccharimonadales bacterium]|nr:hypothetical protein [Candidatus Saccharimonadales bacterium]